MRVLHLGKYYPPEPGGIESFCAALCRAQARSGLTVTALVHDRRAGRLEDEEIDGVRVVRAPIHREFLFTPLSSAFPRALARLAADFRPQVVHLHLPNPSALWLLAQRRLASVPAVAHWHSDIVSSPLRRGLRLAYPLFRPLENALLRRLDAVIATSPPYLESSRPLARWRRKCHVVPLGIDPASVGPRSGETRWPGSGLRILGIGRFTYYKGFLDLVEALPRLDGATLVLVGSGEQEGALREAIERRGLASRARLVTDADDGLRNRYLAEADVLCQPSLERTEAFGLVLLEAFAAGCPVVAARVPGSGAPWLVETSGGGLTVGVGDRDGLAAALARLRDDPGLRRTLAARGRKALEERFHIDRVADTVRRVYRDGASTED